MKVILCNAPVDQAALLARHIIESHLAACVNILSPVTSIYRWQGEVCEEQEATLLIKVASAKAEALRDALVRAHPYDVPEVVCLGAEEALSHTEYWAWVEAQ